MCIPATARSALTLVYQIGLQEHDEKTLYVARQNLNDLRNIYAVLFDILNKNIQKVGGQLLLQVDAY
jgi:hypothetical protein